ncbi:hypothetical protein AMTRI_Chr09g38150 [Amborella trichopoda]
MIISKAGSLIVQNLSQHLEMAGRILLKAGSLIAQNLSQNLEMAGSILSKAGSLIEQNSPQHLEMAGGILQDTREAQRHNQAYISIATTITNYDHQVRYKADNNQIRPSQSIDLISLRSVQHEMPG